MSLTLRKIKNTGFPALYERFLLNIKMTQRDYEAILALAVIFLNSDNLIIQKLGYRIVVIYTNRTKDFAPLYEVAINKGLYPIAKLIDEKHLAETRKNFFTELNASLIEAYKEDSIYLSEQQYLLNRFYLSHKNGSVSVVAPTSYGKTSLIIKTIADNPGKNICIITPTKSLLAQTRKRVLDANIPGLKKIVVHPDMYNPSDLNCVAVLTQERLLRLLKNHPDLFFDFVVVDEAHNIIENDQREALLASVIIVLNKRNKETAFKFLTPFIKDSNNLKVRYAAYDISAYAIDEYVKTEKIYLYDIRQNKGLKLYDQYMNEWYSCPSEPKGQTSIQYIRKHAGDKNIIYFNKPADIERFAAEMIVNMPDIPLNSKLKKAIRHISEYIDPEYTIVKCLRKGIIYHHGSVPDTIRSYIEYLYAAFPEIKYVITSSTLLEGVNMPASKLFIMDHRKGRSNLTHASFRNLFGRVCRFSEIFDSRKGTLQKLEPEIHLVLDKYYPQNANMENYISSVMKEDKSFADDVKNILLENTTITPENQRELSQAREFIENYETGTIENYTERYATTEVGKQCILNNINEVDIFTFEKDIATTIDNILSGNTIKTSGQLLDAICSIFLPFAIREDRNSNFLRFQNDAAKAYYKMFLAWKIDSMSYNQLIYYTVRYWRSLISEGRDTIVYVGKWGDVTRGGYNPLWTNVKNKDQIELINLAIVRIKEEQDFIDNTIMKFVEVLNDLQLVDDNLYLKTKYGTSDQLEIIMIRNGISLTLTKLLLEKYKKYVLFNIEDDTVTLCQDLIDAMAENDENQILICEADSNIIKNS